MDSIKHITVIRDGQDRLEITRETLRDNEVAWSIEGGNASAVAWTIFPDLKTRMEVVRALGGNPDGMGDS